MISDLFLLSYKNLKRRKLRTFLTLLGIVIEVSAVVALVSIGQGMQMSINEMFESVGADRLTITPGGGVETGVTPISTGLSASKLYEHDVDVIKDVDGVEHAFGMISETAKVEFKDQVKYLMVFGVPTDSKSQKMSEGIDLFTIEEGRDLKNGDDYKAVAASDIASGSFDKDINIGDKVFIEDIEFRIVGIQKKSGSPIHDRMLVIHIDTARELFNKSEEVSTIFAQVEEGRLPREVADKIEEAMRDDRDLEEGDEDFTVASAEQMLSSLNMIIGAVQGVLIGIAAISLFVGGIGIMNTMYTSVMEQTRNIGLMKAVGAKSRHIMLLFLIESGIVGLIGGVIGISIGIGVGKITEIVAAGMGLDIFKAAVTPELIVSVMLFSFIIGATSGLLPARHASKLDPIASLRYGA